MLILLKRIMWEVKPMREKIVNFYAKNQQFIKRTLIILYDLVVVWVAGVLALLLRFDLSFSKIPV